MQGSVADLGRLPPFLREVCQTLLTRSVYDSVPDSNFARRITITPSLEIVLFTH